MINIMKGKGGYYLKMRLVGSFKYENQTSKIGKKNFCYLHDKHEPINTNP